MTADIADAVFYRYAFVHVFPVGIHGEAHCRENHRAAVFLYFRMFTDSEYGHGFLVTCSSSILS